MPNTELRVELAPGLKGLATVEFVTFDRVAEAMGIKPRQKARYKKLFKTAIITDPFGNDFVSTQQLDQIIRSWGGIPATHDPVMALLGPRPDYIKDRAKP